MELNKPRDITPTKKEQLETVVGTQSFYSFAEEHDLEIRDVGDKIDNILLISESNKYGHQIVISRCEKGIAVDYVDCQNQIIVGVIISGDKPSLNLDLNNLGIEPHKFKK